MTTPHTLKILLLTDRDWTHPQGGGTGTNLYGQVSRWVAWGHHITVIAGDYEGAAKHEQLAPNLEIHRMGTRMTVFPRAAWRTARGLGRDADVVLEVVNGVAFFTPLWWWLRKPRVALVHHVHRDHYVAEMGRRGKLAAFVAETLPLRWLYRGTPVLTISRAAHDDLVDLGVDSADVHVAYMGVEPSQFRPGQRTPTPTLLYLGRLKQYKRIEHTLDVLEGCPGATLEIAGDGDHRPALEAEIERRGLRDRVKLLGFVAESDKAGLYGSAWLNLTASSAEGWCLTVMEAAACGTPSAALRVGGLAESIVDGDTGLLAEEPEELTRRVRALLDDPGQRDALGAAAEARARGFTWENTATANLAVLEKAAAAPRVSLRAGLRKSETAKASGLAAATLVTNAIQLVFTIIFTRLLGASGYGSLAALVSAFLILLVGGQAVQVAAARETALHRLGDGADLGRTVVAWTRELLVAAVAMAALGVVLRDPIASVVGTPEQPWAAAAIPVTGVLWLLLSLQRGIFQGLHDYAPVGWSLIGEGFGRLAGGLALYGAGLGVTGAFLGTPLELAVTAIVLGVLLNRRVHAGAGGVASFRELLRGAVHGNRTLRSLLGGAWAPIVGLALLAVLQNIDVIVVKHRVGGDAAGSYAVAAVAAKAVVWVAIGIALHLLPEATRRAAAGLNPIPVLFRAYGVLAVVATPALLIFAAVPHVLLKVAFGPKLTQASGALILLGIAMTLLAVAYLTVQYMLALGRVSFMWVLGLVAVLEPIALIAGHYSLLGYATVVLGVQCAVALGVVTLGLRARGKMMVAPVAT